MDNRLFHLFGKSSKKIFFLFNLHSQQFDYLSEAVERIWQVDRELIISKPRHLVPRIHPDDKKAVFRRFKEIIEEGVAHEVEISLVMPDGSRKEVRIEAYPIHDEAGSRTHIAGEAEDVTRQSEYVDFLREFGRRKNSALEIIAHDLRGPLAIVKSVAALLESDHQEKKYEEVGTYTNIISNAYDKCLSIITDVLKDEHLKSQTVHLNTQRFELVGAVQNLLHSYRVAKGVDYTFELVTGE